MNASSPDAETTAHADRAGFSAVRHVLCISALELPLPQKENSNAFGTTGLAFRAVLASALFLFFTTAALAATAAPEAVASPLPDPGASLLRVLGALAAVIAIFFAFVWLFRNWQRFLVQRGRAPRLNVLEVRSLGGRHSLYVVGYEQDRFLVGTSSNGVNLLTHLPQATAEEATAETAQPAIPFSQALVQALKGK